MITIKTIKKGSTVTSLQIFTVIKVNKKSVQIQDSKGNTSIIRDRHFNKYGMESSTITETKGETAETPTRKLREVSPPKVGRYPKWAISTPKKNFVMMEREAGKVATKESYKEYRVFLKELRNSK